jgi:hypothetical protein
MGSAYSVYNERCRERIAYDVRSDEDRIFRNEMRENSRYENSDHTEHPEHSSNTSESTSDDYETKEDFKEGYILPHEYEYVYSPYNIHTSFPQNEKEESSDCNSPVWIAINTIIKCVLIVRMDFQCRKNDILSETMMKVTINIDGIHDIREDKYRHSKIQFVDETKLSIAKQCLKNYYGDESLVIVRVDSRLPITDLGDFMYNIFKFKRVGDYLCVYV